MPPDPILALLSVVGLFAYTAIGSVVSVLHLTKGFKWQLAAGQWLHKNQRGNYCKADWSGPIANAVFWPVLAAGYALVGIVCGVFGGPVWLGKHVIPYVYSALEK